MKNFCKLAFCVTTKVLEQICNEELGSTLTFKSFLHLEVGRETFRSILDRNKSILKSQGQDNINVLKEAITFENGADKWEVRNLDSLHKMFFRYLTILGLMDFV